MERLIARLKSWLRIVALAAALVSALAYLLWVWGWVLDHRPAQAATPEEVRIIRAENDRVNRLIRYRPDRDQYGVPDVTVANPVSNRGDCEDYAATKRANLIAMGFAPERLRLIFVEVQTRRDRWDGHAVLVVDNEWVLDSIVRQVVSVAAMRTYYHWGMRFPGSE